MTRRPLASAASLAALALALPLLLAACGPKGKAGDACSKEGAQICQDKSTSLVCMEGKWEALPCRGLTGCMPAGDGASCNNQGYNDGEPCLEDGNYDCKVDKKAMLQCRGKRWKTVEKCLGPTGCVANAKGAKCDNSTSEAGAPCEKDDTYACSVDKMTLLRCTGGKLVPHATCPGLYNCRKQFDKVECNGEQPLKN
jgi:hypothetical protein